MTAAHVCDECGEQPEGFELPELPWTCPRCGLRQDQSVHSWDRESWVNTGHEEDYDE